ncbi:hypothetical protein BCR34DRAFT_589361 [Clohesyomyces aquaticus]|uniref:BTB domain-containing protein n=1 Tax=Clohesyomyces aquaticus TaxID=1231657 RepID=A0A1Y1ZGJ0_9PLEO|nr:hypothetical protein BCR34DRAFT_589361 [Clohesyomyces aquaticus]
MDKSAPRAAQSGVKTYHNIVVDPAGDFVIRLNPSTQPLTESVNSAERARVFNFTTSRQVIAASSAYFSHVLGLQPESSIISMENNGLSRAFEIWLRALHNGVGSIPTSLQAARVEDVWNVLGVGWTYGFAPEHTDAIKPWFIAIYERKFGHGALSPMLARTMAFPCVMLDHAEGFMKLTKYLVYKTNGSMFMHNPSASYEDLTIKARLFDGPLTAARTSVQSVLEKELNFPLEKLHYATCPCRKETAFDYEDALLKIDCWPLEKALKQYPIEEVIGRLRKFEFVPKTTSCESKACLRDFKRSVNIAIDRAQQEFQGLCADCVKRSKPAAGRSPEAFLEKNSPYHGCWDMDCRYGHGRGTWFFSWMGPSSVRQQILYTAHREQLQAKGSHRPTRRPRRARTITIHTGNREGIETLEVPQTPFAPMTPPLATGNGEIPMNAPPTGLSDKENARDRETTYDSDEEFFEAEEGDFDIHADADADADADAEEVLPSLMQKLRRGLDDEDEEE